jgi:signal transduction histidine kinase
VKDNLGINDDLTEPASPPRHEPGIEPGSPLVVTELPVVWETEGFLSLNPEWRVIRANNHAQRILRRSADHLIGHAIWGLWPDLPAAMLKKRLPATACDAAGSLVLYSHEIAARVRLHIHTAVDGFSVILQELTDHKRPPEAALPGQDHDARTDAIPSLRKGVSTLSVETNPQAVATHGETAFAGDGRDPAERLRLEAERRDLARRLVTAQEDERRRIARELHDEMGQYIAALSLGVQALEPALRDSPPYYAQLVRLKGIIQHIGQDVHRIAYELRPPALDDLGLEAALKNHLEVWARTYKCSADIHCHGLVDCTLPDEVETALYRVVQEGLTNIVKHARATSISVVVDRRLSEVDLIIEDDGIGFDPEALESSREPSGHLGLMGTRERLSVLGGTLTIESGPGRGTTLFAHIPLEVVRAEGTHHG